MRAAALIVLLTAIGASPATAGAKDDHLVGMTLCRVIKDDAARLRCYDSAALKTIEAAGKDGWYRKPSK